jgi:hypothetical protein
MAYFEIKSEFGVNPKLAAVRKNNWQDILQALPSLTRPAYADKYTFYIAKKAVSYEQFVQAARDQRDLYFAARDEKYAFLPVSQGVTGLQKRMVRVRRDKLAHRDGENCQCSECFNAA